MTDFDRARLSLSGPGVARSYDSASVRNLALREHDLILEKSGGGPKSPVGFVVRCGPEAVGQMCSNFVARVRPRDGVSSEWLVFVFGALYALGRNAPFVKQVTGIQNLDTEAYLSLEVPKVSTAEQLALAGRANQSLARTLALAAEYQEIGAALVEYRNALITEAVTGKLDVLKLDDSRMVESLAAVREGERPEVLSS